MPICLPLVMARPANTTMGQAGSLGIPARRPFTLAAQFFLPRLPDLAEGDHVLHFNVAQIAQGLGLLDTSGPAAFSEGAVAQGKMRGLEDECPH